MAGEEKGQVQGQASEKGALGHKSAATTRIYLDKLAPRSAKAGKAVQKAIEEAR